MVLYVVVADVEGHVDGAVVAGDVGGAAVAD